MKTIKETKEVIVGYEALDGTRFDTEKDCRDYENSAVCAIDKQFLDFSSEKRVIYYSVNEDDSIFLVDITSPERLTLANMWAKAHFGTTPFKESMIGQKVAVNTGYGCDYEWVMGTREEMIAAFIKNIVNPIFGEDET